MNLAVTQSCTNAAFAPYSVVNAARVLLGAVLAALVLAAPAGAAAAEPRPVLLLIHGGGFVEGSPAMMDYAATIAAREGEFATLQPYYPLNDLAGAFERLADAALALEAQGREAYAYGDSAGGAIAVWLAANGYVEAAAGKAPPTALVGWRSATARHYATAAASDRRSWRHLRATPRVRRQYSTAFRSSLRPVRIYQSCADTVVPCGINLAFSRRDPNVSLRETWGPHKDRAAKAFSFESGLRWLAGQAGLDEPALAAEA
jgi:acetyl esterase/lipase